MRTQAWFAIFAIPIFPILVAWWKWRGSRRTPSGGTIFPLVVATASQVWVLSVFATQWFLGPSYSNVRFGIILVNFLATLAAASVSLIRGLTRPPRTPKFAAAISCLLLAIEWLIIGAASWGV